MSYTRTTWVDGTTPVDASRLNNIEGGLVDHDVRLAGAETEIASLASGSPKGTYATLAELEAAHPTGDTGMYVIGGNAKEIDTLSVTGAPTVSGNVTIILNGVSKTVAVLSTDSTSGMATKIRAATFPGWTTGGSGTSVTFTNLLPGVVIPPFFGAGTTGSTATFAVSTLGTVYGDWYTWNGTAWTYGGVYLATAVMEKAISYRELSDNVLSDTHKELDYGTYEIGTLDATTGLPISNAARMRPTDYTIAQKAFLKFINDGVAEYSVFCFDKDTQAKIYSTAWLTTSYYEIPYADCLIKTIMRRVGTPTLTTDDIPILLSKLSGKGLIPIIDKILDGSITPEKTSFITPMGTLIINMFNKATAESGGYYNYATGVWTASGTASSTAPIPVEYGDRITFKSIVGSGYHITFWNAANEFISGEYVLLSAGQEHSTNIPLDGKYVKIAFKNTELNTFMVVINRDYPGEYYAYGVTANSYEFSPEIKAAIQQLVGLDNKLYSLKWGIVGDSIPTIGYKGDGREYPKQIADRNSIVLQNLSVPGSMITKTSISGHTTDHMCEMVSTLDADCDIVTIAGGVNDLRNNVSLGTFGDADYTTFYGALDTLCKNMIARFPTKPKAIFTPIKYRGHEETMKPFVTAINEVANKYAIPVLNMFIVCDLQPDIDAINSSYFYESDGLHPNGDGHAVLARTVENYLRFIV